MKGSAVRFRASAPLTYLHSVGRRGEATVPSHELADLDLAVEQPAAARDSIAAS